MAVSLFVSSHTGQWYSLMAAAAPSVSSSSSPSSGGRGGGGEGETWLMDLSSSRKHVHANRGVI